MEIGVHEKLGSGKIYWRGSESLTTSCGRRGCHCVLRLLIFRRPSTFSRGPRLSRGDFEPAFRSDCKNPLARTYDEA